MKKKSGFAPLSVLVVAAVLALSGCTFVITEYPRVVYNKGDAESGYPPTDVNSYAPGTTFEALQNTGNLARVNYLFNGWHMNVDGTWFDLLPGEKHQIGMNDVSSYPKWKSWTTLIGYWTIYYTRTQDGSSDVRHIYLISDGEFTDDKLGSGNWTIQNNSIGIQYGNNTSFPAGTLLYGDILADCASMQGDIYYASNVVASWYAQKGYLSAAGIEQKARAFTAKKLEELVR